MSYTRTHFIRYYACGQHVSRQCRCADPAKKREVSTTPCPICAKPEPPSQSAPEPEATFPEVGTEAILTDTIKTETEGGYVRHKLKPKTGVRVRVLEIIREDWIGRR